MFYDFTITAEQIKREQTIRKKMNMEISGGDGGNLILKELTMNDLLSPGLRHLGVTPDDKWLNEYELKLKGTDSFGNPVSFEAGFGPENELRLETSVFGDYEEGDEADEDNFPDVAARQNCQYLDLQLYQRKTGDFTISRNNWMMNIGVQEKLILTSIFKRK